MEINSEGLLISSSVISPAYSHLVVYLNVLGFPGLAPIFIHCPEYWFGKGGILGRCWVPSNSLTFSMAPPPILANVGESEGGDYRTKNWSLRLGWTVLWMVGKTLP